MGPGPPGPIEFSGALLPGSSVSMSDPLTAAPTAGLPRPPSRLRERVHKSWPAVAFGLLILLVWENVETWFDMKPYILPPPSTIAAVGWNGWSTIFWPNAKQTLIEIAIGFPLAWVIGFVTATAVFHVSLLSRGLLPYIVMSQAIPTIAMTPIYIIWFGFNIIPKLIVIVTISFFPLVINTLAGYRSVEHDALNLMKSLGASEKDIFTKVRFPAALPYIFTGTRLTAVVTPIGAFVGEFFGADMGVAPLMLAMLSAFKTAEMFMAIIMLAGMAISLFLIVVIVERLLIPWYFIARG